MAATIKTLIKWPGGKQKEFRHFQQHIPLGFERYVEPFCGGAAVFFGVDTNKAILNDLSKELVNFYAMVKTGNDEFRNALYELDDYFQGLIANARSSFQHLKRCLDGQDDISKYVLTVLSQNGKIFLMKNEKEVKKMFDLIKTMVASSIALSLEKNGGVIEEGGIGFEKVVAGFCNGFYLYVRGVMNDGILGRVEMSQAFLSAVYMFIREYCFCGMFRVNGKGEFNVAYAGMSQTNRDFRGKVDRLFSEEIRKKFENTEIYNMDFELLLNSIDLTENDFVFLDPPYDESFSSYDGNKAFSKDDHRRLFEFCKRTPAKILQVIKNTDFIYELYRHDFNICTFDKKYDFQIKNRFDRDVKHLIIKNY